MAPLLVLANEKTSRFIPFICGYFFSQINYCPKIIWLWEIYGINSESKTLYNIDATLLYWGTTDSSFLFLTQNTKMVIQKFPSQNSKTKLRWQIEWLLNKTHKKQPRVIYGRDLLEKNIYPYKFTYLLLKETIHFPLSFQFHNLFFQFFLCENNM